MNFDLDFDFGTFDDTTVKIKAISEKGIAFLESHLGENVIGCEVLKSTSQTIWEVAMASGIKCC